MKGVVGVSRVEERLAALGLVLPKPPPVKANYLSAIRVGNLVHTSCTTCFDADGRPLFVGKVDSEVSAEDAYRAARLTALQLLAVLKETIGDLDRIERIIRVTGYVNSDPDFYGQSAVINGASDLLVQVFGENGRHIRAAQAVPTASFNVSVVLEMVAQVKE